LKMKRHSGVSSSRRKARKAHFQAPSHIRRIMMAVHLSKELAQKWKVSSTPVRKDDEVQITKGRYKGRDGKIVSCIRRSYSLHIEKLTREKANGATVYVPVKPNYCVVTKLKLDKNRREKFEAVAASLEKNDKDKGKITTAEVQSMATVD